jgi:phosphoglycolate phosphatase
LPEENRDEATIKKVFESFFKYYSEHYLDKTVAYEGILDVLESLKSDGMKIAVVSNKRDDMAKIVVDKIFGDIFDFVVGKREGYPTKPDPKLTLEVIDILGVTPKECAFVGDSGMDMAAAKNSGCLAVGVLWGFREAEELNQNGADYILNTTNQITELIRELNNGCSN